MTTIKQMAKNVAGETLLRTGLWRRHLQRMARRDEAIVLTYHRVIDKWDRTLDYSQPGMVVTSDTFDHQLAFLKKHFDIVPLSSLVNSQSQIRNPQSPFVPLSSLISKFEFRNSKSPARPLCAVTFDDGWRDNYEIAFPILRKHSVPATLFLTTDFIGTNRSFWHTELMYLLLHGELVQLRRSRRDFDAFPASLRPHLIRLARLTQAPSAHDVDPLIEAVKDTCDENSINELMRDLAAVLRRRRPFLTDRRFFLDWDQVREMASADIEIGSHGCTHRPLSRLSEEQAMKELLWSKHEIENQINCGVNQFAFPHVAWNPRLLDLVSQAGYQTACLGIAGRRQSSGYDVVHRVGAHEGISVGSSGMFSEGTFGFTLVRSQRLSAW